MTMFDLSTMATVMIAVLALSLALAAYRMLKGPGYADRIVALDMLTAVVVSLSALTSLAQRKTRCEISSLGSRATASCAFSSAISVCPFIR